MIRLRALAGVLAACALLPSTALADVQETRAAYWRFDDTGFDAEIVGNPGFEVDTTGHSAAAGYFTSAATSVVRDTSSAHTGAASGAVTVPGTAGYEGVRYRIDQTFEAGTTYAFSVWVRAATATNNVNVALGTGADNAGASNGPVALGPGWKRLSGTWTPGANRTSVDLGVYLPAAAGSAVELQVDDVSVQKIPQLVGNTGFEVDTAGYSGAAGYFTSPATAVAQDTSNAHSGTASGLVTVPGTAGYEGVRYRINQTFESTATYAFSVWVRATTATNNVNVALGTGADNAGASNGPVALGTGWKRLYGTWTPSANRTSVDLGVYLPGAAGSEVKFQVDDLSVTKVVTVNARDAVGSNHGTYAGGYFLNQAGATPDGGRAVELDGVNGRITTAYAPFAQGSVRTFEGWAKRSTTGSDDAIFAGDAATGYPVLRAKAGTSGDVRFNPNTTGQGQDFAGALPGAGVWFHWALVWNDASREATLFVDGERIDTKTFTFGLAPSPGNLELGAEGGTTNPFNGHLDDVAVYNRALGWSEIRHLAGTATCDSVLPSTGIATPAQLIAALEPGDTGCLRSGTYSDSVTCNPAGRVCAETTIDEDDVTLRSYPGERATIAGRLRLLGDRVAVKGLNLDGTTSRCKHPLDNPDTAGTDPCAEPGDGRLPSPTINGSDALLLDNDVTAPKGICVNTTASNGHVPDRFLVHGNRMHECGRRSLTDADYHDHAVYVVDGRFGEIRNNVIWQTINRAVQLFPEALDTTIASNTIDDNGSGIHFAGLEFGDGSFIYSDRNVAANNVVTRSNDRYNLEATYHLDSTSNGGGSTDPTSPYTENKVLGVCLMTATGRPTWNIENHFGRRVLLSSDTTLTAGTTVYDDASTRDYGIRSGTCPAGMGASGPVTEPF